ncbi:MAG: phosphate acyltransferase PlsX [Flavobacteriales bacterium]|jgi:phosphate acyltransferase|nr:phosphate acyltransferase PlsX [Flavobacteriales bacterium]MBT6815648.1 phosphate acyltransferase PlsX [Flavobacteriales bacterium]MBT7620690.1 phosphate acyltransferase PlsX [Flavobacteriales bacterium]
MRIGIDVMGGDYAPKKTVHGAILAQKDLPRGTEIVLFGKKEDILSELKSFNISSNIFEIVDCSEVIEMGEHAVKGIKQKTKSSISVGFHYLATGKIDGFASAGNTGAMFVGGFYSVKAITGIIRPCISSVLPKQNGGVGILLDVGANPDCKADVLYQFGILGSLFAQHVCGIEYPKIGLLNLGEEKTKGSMLTQAAYEIMEDSKDYNFIGNIEGRDLFEEDSDVIVCDGFTGNIVLKQSESFYNLMKKRGYDDEYFNRFNYENYGGTPILGLNKTVIIGHGISNEIAIKNMITLTKDVVEADLSTKIKEILN